MTAATETRLVLEDRWRTITRDVRRFQGEGGLATVNSDRWTMIDETLEELGAMLVDEADADDLLPLTEGIWAAVRIRMLDWAAGLEAERAGKVAAA